MLIKLSPKKIQRIFDFKNIKISISGKQNEKEIGIDCGTEKMDMRAKKSEPTIIDKNLP